MKLRAAWLVVKESVQEFVNDEAMSHAAGISFYTALGLAPTVLLFLSLAGFLGGVGEQSLVNQVRELAGEQAAEGVAMVVKNAGEENRRTRAGVISTIIGVATFLFSASGVFAQLQHALNKMWNVMPRPGAGAGQWIRKRLLSMAMVLGLLVLMFASLAANAAIALLLAESGVPWGLINTASSIVIFTAGFGLIFKFLPDVKADWRDVLAGALMTAVLFTLGKHVIGLYLGHSSVGSSYGMAGSLIALLVWVYYSAIIILFGAEMTQVYARRFGGGIHPDRHAVRVE
jgi:membrane protein